MWILFDLNSNAGVLGALFSLYHVCAGLVLVQPSGFVLGQLLPPVAHRGPATAGLLGRVHQTLTVRRPSAGGVEDLTRLHPSDLPVVQQVPNKVLTLIKTERMGLHIRPCSSL